LVSGSVSGTMALQFDNDGTTSYLSANSSTKNKSAIATSQSEETSWTIDGSINSSTGAVQLIGSGTGEYNYLRYNNGSTRYATYLSTSSVEDLVAIYKLEGSGNETVLIVPTCVTPTISQEDNVVTISTTTEGATIYYTIDGSDPSATNYAGSGTTSLTYNITETITIKAIAILSGYADSEIASADCAFVSEDVVTLYETGFEDSDFATSTTYNSTQTTGPDGYQWKTYYGCVSTSSKINGNNSVAMRLYSSASTTYGYTQMEFDLTNVTVTTFSFQVKVGNTNLMYDVLYSTDEGTTWTAIESGVSAKTTAAEKSISLNQSYDKVRFRIAISASSTAPTSKNYQLTIDDIVIKGKNNNS